LVPAAGTIAVLINPNNANAERDCIKPVTLPPGRPRLSTKPAPTGSATFTNTIGTIRVACNNAAKPAVPLARMMSGPRAANSTACLRMVSAWPKPQK
jgi:hypothetical protein